MQHSSLAMCIYDLKSRFSRYKNQQIHIDLVYGQRVTGYSKSQMLKLTRCTILFEHLCESVKLMGRKVKRKKEIQNDSQSTANPFLSNDPFRLFVNATSLLCF